MSTVINVPKGKIGNTELRDELKKVLYDAYKGKCDTAYISSMVERSKTKYTKFVEIAVGIIEHKSSNREDLKEAADKLSYIVSKLNPQTLKLGISDDMLLSAVEEMRSMVGWLYRTSSRYRIGSAYELCMSFFPEKYAYLRPVKK